MTADKSDTPTCSGTTASGEVRTIRGEVAKIVEDVGSALD